MSGNSSQTAGFLTPVAPLPTEDDELTDAMQATVVGVTGLPPTMVRPRWQPKQPTQPPPDVDWAAIGLVTTNSVDYPYFITRDQPDGSVSTQMRRNTLTDWIASFYGPNEGYYAGLFRDGMYVPQNLEYLASFGLKMYEVSEALKTPELTNNQYIGRSDVKFRMARQVNRQYNILSILSYTPFIVPSR